MSWGYWGSVGRVASEGYRARMAKLGIGSIEPEEGMAALERLLGGSLSQTIFLKTTSSRALGAGERQTQAAAQAPSLIHGLSLHTQRTLTIRLTVFSLNQELFHDFTPTCTDP